MKKIAITQRLIANEDYYELREALDVNWGKLFNKLDFLPIVLPIEYDFKNYFDNIGIDGILLTGGNDLNSLKPSKISEKRDSYEKSLIKFGIENCVPILGVCRGMQIICEYFGSSIVAVEDQVAIKHSLNVNKESKYYSLLKKIKNVNSYHNYAANILPKELLVSARSEDGIIKAIEHKQYAIFGQMWHSERESPLNKQEIELIKYFFNTKR